MSKGKRAATNQLTHDNWQDEDEAEEAGQFQVASEEQVKQRKIVTARRKLRPDSDSSANSNGAFSGFQGFSKTPDTTATSKTTTSQFDFLSNMIKSKSNGADKSAADVSAGKPGEDSDEYLSKMEVLNKSVLKWITQHVESCPTCDLTPVFKDYEKHHAEFQKAGDAKIEQKIQPKPASDSTKVEPLKPGFFGLTAPASKSESKESFSFGSSNTKAKEESKSALGSFTFGAKKVETVKESSTDSSDSNSVEKPVNFGFGGGKPSTAFAPVFGKTSEAGEAVSKPFSFGAGSAASAASGLFSTAAANTTFGTGSFSFGGGGLSGASSVVKSEAVADTGADADDDAPPVNDFTQVTETDSLYSTKCKLYFKKDASYQEKGVGMLYIKSLEDSTQLLIRADTNLGNILLNVRLQAGMSASKLQDKNVSLICVPNPPINPKKPDDKPVAMLIKVKNADIADELLTQIKSFTD